MKSLGEVADRQTPALQNLDASARQITRLLRPARAVRAGLAPGAPLARPGVGDRRQGGEGGRRRRSPLLNGVAQGTPEVSEGPRDRSSATSTTGSTRSRRTRAAPAGRATRGSRRCCSTSMTRRRRRRSTTRTATSSRSPCSPASARTTPTPRRVKDNPSLLRSAARSSARTSPGSRPRTSRGSRTRGRTPPATSRGGAATRPRRRAAGRAVAARADPSARANEPAPSAPTVPGAAGRRGQAAGRDRAARDAAGDAGRPVGAEPARPCVPPRAAGLHAEPRLGAGRFAPGGRAAREHAAGPAPRHRAVLGGRAVAAAGLGQSQQLLDYLLKP